MKPVALPRALALLKRLEFPHKLGIGDALFGKALEKLGTCWVETAAGITWKLDLTNPTHRWIVYGKYEGREFIDWAARHLRPDATIVDSGANIGQMLLCLVQYVSRGRILAFEPGAEAAAWLEECLAEHPNLPVELLRLGLGERNALMFLSPLGPPGSHGSWNQISATDGEPVQVVSLDEIAGQHGIRHVDLWKLDVEGHEISALLGASSLLQNKRVGALYVELGCGKGAEIVKLLAEFNYRGFLFDRRGRLHPLSGLPDHSNGLFLPEMAMQYSSSNFLQVSPMAEGQSKLLPAFIHFEIGVLF